MFGSITAQKLSENDDGTCVMRKLTHLNDETKLMVLRQAVMFGVTICDSCLQQMTSKTVPICTGL